MTTYDAELERVLRESDDYDAYAYRVSCEAESALARPCRDCSEGEACSCVCSELDR